MNKSVFKGVVLIGSPFRNLGPKSDVDRVRLVGCLADSLLCRKWVIGSEKRMTRGFM